MGVAGCGKSSLGLALAQALRLPLIEGDDHHSPASRAKMSEGIALTDADREGWLTTLGQLLQAHPQGAVLTCSALKKAYRDRLRAACIEEGQRARQPRLVVFLRDGDGHGISSGLRLSAITARYSCR